ncbi:hypothetical protein CIG2463D_0245 [Campylobacter iguaniorum]|uniref:Uncharacterized protein n=1 Tax=Campylobacter iguaniorum TaxID=1244531 RepID=A0A076F7T6_9BACT|nr:hypothetical protein [Campylobacter iguaniorum]AII14111.1 hypothetical protein CIG1485E_0240 [Campylobacter iguaniorum]ALV23850.1 hypothetical protein CIG2463D_0245 [Campylobacter iguaniorum]
MRFAIILSVLALFFVACSEKKEQKIEVTPNTVVPADVPIAKSDANISIDKDFPPMPVAE